MEVKHQFYLNMAISLALNDVLSRHFGHRAKIKWPNDGYVDNEKIAGILIENIVQGNQIKYAIIGIGLNVNQSKFPYFLKNVTSFKKILHIDYDLHHLKNEICSFVEARYLQLKAGKYQALHEDYLDKLYLKDVWSWFKINGQGIQGKILSVSAEGFLQVETAAGLQSYGFKEIEFVRM